MGAKVQRLARYRRVPMGCTNNATVFFFEKSFNLDVVCGKKNPADRFVLKEMMQRLQTRPERAPVIAVTDVDANHSPPEVLLPEVLDFLNDARMQA